MSKSITKKFLLFIFMISLTSLGLSQGDNDDTFTFTTNSKRIEKYKKTMPSFSRCYYAEKKEAINKCFLHSIQSHIKNNIEYPLENLLRKENGSVKLTIHFSPLGSINDIDIIDSSHESFKNSAIAVVNSIPFFKPAQHKGQNFTFKLEYTFDFNYTEWIYKPAYMHDFSYAYYKSTLRDSTSVYPGCDTCKTVDDNSSNHRISVLSDLEKQLQTNADVFFPKEGHVFTKYSIDASGNFVPFEYVLENTTLISDADYNSMIRSIAPLSASALAELNPKNMEFKLLLYFTKTGLMIGRPQSNGLIRAERMPVFPGECQALEDAGAQARCSEGKLINAVMLSARYPEIAKENGDQGKVFLTFVVEQTGYISNVEILKGVSPEIDQSAIDAVKSLPRLTPAVQKGKPVKLKYTIPVNYRLH